MRITDSPMLGEVNGADSSRNAPLPEFAGGKDATLIECLDQRINGDRRPRLMSKWAILAYVRATREAFPDGGFDATRDQVAVARKVGYLFSGAALSMARRVMEALAALKQESGSDA